jgi:hypothetical protein
MFIDLPSRAEDSKSDADSAPGRETRHIVGRGRLSVRIAGAIFPEVAARDRSAPERAAEGRL